MTTKSFQNPSFMQRIELAIFYIALAIAYVSILMLIMKPYLTLIKPISMLFVQMASVYPFDFGVQFLAGILFVLSQITVLIVPFVFIKFLLEIFFSKILHSEY